MANFRNANIKLLLFDLADLDDPLHKEDELLLAMAKETPEHVLLVLNKADISGGPAPDRLQEMFGDLPRVCVSAKTGGGLQDLIARLEVVVKTLSVHFSSNSIAILSYSTLQFFWSLLGRANYDSSAASSGP